MTCIPVTKTYERDRFQPFMSHKFKRRDTDVHFYLPIRCPFLRGCPDGSCPLAHTKLEVIFHPIVYKTRRCKMSISGQCMFSQKCTFYNNETEKVCAEQLWRLWEKTWNLWRLNIENVLVSHNKLSDEVSSSLAAVMNYRSRMKPPKNAPKVKHRAKAAPEPLPDCMLQDHQSSLTCFYDIPEGVPLLSFASAGYKIRTNSTCDEMGKHIVEEWFFKKSGDL